MLYLSVMKRYWEEFLNWVYDYRALIISVVAIIIATYVLNRFGDLVINRTVRKVVNSRNHPDKEEEEKREDTLIDIFNSILRVITWPIAIIIIIAQFDFNLTAILASIGVAGVAIGFGAQNLVKDIIAGFFIIFENQYRVGDVVEIDEKSGMVEHITLRRTVLRDLDGIVHHVPNGQINVASNFTSEKSGINLNVGVAYDSDLDKVIKVINQVGKDLGKDSDWKDRIVDIPEFERVDNFGDSSIDIKITGTVTPLQQWNVTGELRKRLKVAFDKNNIEIPFPQRVIHQAKKPSKKRK